MVRVRESSENDKTWNRIHRKIPGSKQSTRRSRERVRTRDTSRKPSLHHGEGKPDTEASTGVKKQKKERAPHPGILRARENRSDGMMGKQYMTPSS